MPGGIWLSPTSRLGTGGFLYNVYGHQFQLVYYYSELYGCCGQTEMQCFELVCLTLDMKSQIHVFPGLLLYWYVKFIEVTHSPCWRVVLMVSKRFGLLRSRIDLQRLCGSGTKKGWLKMPRGFELARLHLCP